MGALGVLCGLNQNKKININQCLCVFILFLCMHCVFNIDIFSTADGWNNSLIDAK